jgi:hypothetical protein
LSIEGEVDEGDSGDMVDSELEGIVNEDDFKGGNLYEVDDGDFDFEILSLESTFFDL